MMRLRPPEPEILRRRRQLGIFEDKGRKADAMGDEAGAAAAQLSYESTRARIAELETEAPGEQPRRRRGHEGG